MEKYKQTINQSDEIEIRLRDMILNMELGPGEPVTERWLEAHLGASRTPVRTALLRLEAEGLIRREGRGWIVTPLDVNEIEQLFVYREVLETAALRLAAGQVNHQALDALDVQLESFRNGISKEMAHEVGTAFHIKLAELSGNDFISKGVADAIIRLSRVRLLDTDVQHHGWDEHQRILAALRTGDTDSAVKHLENHIRESRDRLLNVLKSSRLSFRARGVQPIT